jgi:hypothetical protein
MSRRLPYIFRSFLLDHFLFNKLIVGSYVRPTSSLASFLMAHSVLISMLVQFVDCTNVSWNSQL